MQLLHRHCFLCFVPLQWLFPPFMHRCDFFPFAFSSYIHCIIHDCRFISSTDSFSAPVTQFFVSPPPSPAKAPGHFLSAPPATPHHHQPHRPLPSSERSAHTQALPRATHHPGHALGTALPLQPMRHLGNQHLPVRVTSMTTHPPSPPRPSQIQRQGRTTAGRLPFPSVLLWNVVWDWGRAPLRTS